MGFRVRRKRVEDEEAAPHQNRDDVKRRTKLAGRTFSSTPNANDVDHDLNQRPSLRTWVRTVWPDIVTLLLVAVAGIAVRHTSVLIRFHRLPPVRSSKHLQPLADTFPSMTLLEPSFTLSLPTKLARRSSVLGSLGF